MDRQFRQATTPEDLSSPPQGSRTYLILIALVATIGAFLFGYDNMIFTGAVIFLKKAFQLSPDQVGWAGSSVTAGCIVGAVIGGWAGNRFGRKKTLILAGLLFGLSAIGTAIPRTIMTFNIFRILGGLGMGVAMVTSPLYIAEIAPAHIRGPLMTINQFVAVVGALISILVGYFLARWMSETVNWRWMFASECVPVAMLLMGLAFIPESPRWLIQQGRRTQGLSVLARINGTVKAEAISAEIVESLELEQKKATSYSELLLPGVRIAIVIAIGLAILQQISGGAALSMYGPIIFQRAGYPKPSDAIGLTVLLFVWHLFCVFIAFLFVERAGRRPLLLIGLGIKALGHFVLAYCFSREQSGLFFIVIYFITVGISNISIAPLAWLIMAEIFPTRIRAKGIAVATFFLFAAQFANNRVFPPLVAWFDERFGTPAGIFITFGVICILGVIFIWRMVPETKGKTLEEISKMFLDRSKSGNSVNNTQ